MRTVYLRSRDCFLSRFSRFSHIFMLLSLSSSYLSTRRLSDVYRNSGSRWCHRDTTIAYSASFLGLSKESRSLSRSRSRSRLDLDIEITNATAHAWIMHDTVRDPDERNVVGRVKICIYMYILVRVFARRWNAKSLQKEKEEGRATMTFRRGGRGGGSVTKSTDRNASFTAREVDRSRTHARSRRDWRDSWCTVKCISNSIYDLSSAIAVVRKYNLGR